MTILSKIRLLGRNTYHTYRTVTYHVTANEQLLQTSGTLSVQVSFPGELGKIGTAANLRIKLKIDENWTKHPAQGCAGRIANILCKAGRLLRSLFHVLFKTTKYRGPSELLYVVKLSGSKE